MPVLFSAKSAPCPRSPRNATHGTASGEFQVYRSWERLFLGDPCLLSSEWGQMCCCRGCPKRESLKVAAGVSRGERGAGKPWGRRDGARVLCALARTWCRLLHRPMQAEHESAHCGGLDRAARELSTAASAERNRLCCRSDCGLACAEGQWDFGGLKFSESVSCSAIAFTKMIQSWET